MILQIADVLDAPTVKAIREALSKESLWEDGAGTAAGRARSVKRNQQAKAAEPAVKGVLDKIASTIAANATIAAAAIPDRLVRLMINRYETGMEYGFHVDAPYIDDARTDVSFTLFLSDPDEYEGGALVIDSAGAEDEVKLPAGSFVLYPSTFLHRVELVTSGRRLAAVGWIKSRIRSAEHRAMLFDLDAAFAEVSAAGASHAVRDKLANLRNNLLRAFGD